MHMTWADLFSASLHLPNFPQLERHLMDPAKMNESCATPDLIKSRLSAQTPNVVETFDIHLQQFTRKMLCSALILYTTTATPSTLCSQAGEWCSMFTAHVCGQIQDFVVKRDLQHVYLITVNSSRLLYCLSYRQAFSVAHLQHHCNHFQTL